jgi:hypothetical protein
MLADFGQRALGALTVIVVIILARMFWPKRSRPPLDAPLPGEIWEDDDGSPWPQSKNLVKVLEVKSGWVLYRYQAVGEGHFLSTAERLKVRDFIRGRRVHPRGFDA